MSLDWGPEDGEYEDGGELFGDSDQEECTEVTEPAPKRRKRTKKKRQKRVKFEDTDYPRLTPIKVEEESARMRARDMPAKKFDDQEIQEKIKAYIESARENSTKSEYRYYAKKFREINNLGEWPGDQTLPPSHTLTNAALLKYLTSMWEERKKKPAVEQSRKWLNYAMGLHGRPPINKYHHTNLSNTFEYNLSCDRQHYAKVLDLLKSIKKTKEWREYRTEGASSFSLEFVEKLMNASVNGPNGKPDMIAARNKAVGVMMILFGAHPLDMHRMHEDQVRIQPEHIDREGYRRPKFVIGGHDQLSITVDCKRKCFKSSNVIGCGCAYHHNHSNPHCAYNIIRQYKPPETVCTW